MDEVSESDGYPIVLAASRAEANEYDSNPFSAFICTFPKKISGYLLKEHLDSLENNDNGSAKRTIYGLRKVESILIDEFGKDKVVVGHYDNLDKLIGKKTKIVGISSMDPMGLAYVSTTYNSLIGFGGEALNAFEFEKLIKHPSLLKFKPKIIVGGAGAWQISEAGKQEEFGIDILGGSLDNFLTEEKQDFHEEKGRIFKVGLEVSAYIKVDDTVS